MLVISVYCIKYDNHTIFLAYWQSFRFLNLNKTNLIMEDIFIEKSSILIKIYNLKKNIINEIQARITKLL